MFKNCKHFTWHIAWEMCFLNMQTRLGGKDSRKFNCQRCLHLLSYLIHCMEWIFILIGEVIIPIRD